MRYFLDLSYKGTNFHGWQIQPNAKSVQEELESALSTILRTETSIIGSGRTDTGVHAKQQIAHFDSVSSIDPDQLTYKLNSFLGADIAVHQIYEVKDTAHARFDAKKRTYRYYLNTTKNPFTQESSYHFSPALKIAQIEKACEIIRKWQNFECFSKVHTEVNTFNCDIFEANWKQIETQHIFTISANRFLRGMVRAIVGTLLDVGTEKTSIEQLEDILKSNDRSKAGRAAPAQGLFLESVEYGSDITTN